MSKVVTFCICIFLVFLGKSAATQSLAVNTDGSAANSSALFDVKATNKGVLIPRMSRTERNAISTPATGLLIFQSSPDSIGFYYYDGSKWTWLLSNANTDSLAWRTSGNASTNLATNYLGTSDAKDLVVRTNATERMRIKSSGFTGIGTTSPGEKLEITGNLKFTGSDTIYAGTGQNTILIHSGDGTASGGALTIRGGNAGQATGGAGGDLNLAAGGNMPFNGSGYSNLGTSGAINLTAGYGFNSAGGNVNIAAGATSYLALISNSHSDVTLKGGANLSANDPASIVVEGGYTSNAINGTGGNLTLKPGTGVGSGNNGSIFLNGALTLGVTPNIAGGTSVSPFSLLNYKTYVNLFPADANNTAYFQLPNAATYPGRTYVLRNNSSSFQVILTSAGGLLFTGSSSTGTTSYTMPTNAAGKTLLVISDGLNWTLMVMN